MDIQGKFAIESQGIVSILKEINMAWNTIVLTSLNMF